MNHFLMFVSKKIVNGQFCLGKGQIIIKIKVRKREKVEERGKQYLFF